MSESTILDVTIPLSIFDSSERLSSESDYLSTIMEEAMKYLCLIYYDEKKLDTMPESERDALYAEAYAYYDELVTSGHGIAGDPLESVESARTVRVQKGKVSITDGPFAETKEQLGGFILMDASDLDEALQLASNIPPARLGGVEVRPIRDMRQR